jgi:hypothetical protein
MPMTEHEASSLDALVKETIAIHAAQPPESFLWFRGVSCSTYELLPKLLRDKKSSEEVFEREGRLLTRFRQRSMAYWPAGYPQNEWEHLFAMQHYGLPTRLLDWSENLFVAAFFALAKAGDGTDAHGHKGDCEPVVYVLNPVQWNKSMPGLSEFSDEIQVLTTADDHLEPYRPLSVKRRPKSPVAIHGTHNSDRIVAQRGTFIVWGAETKTLEEYGNANLRKIRLTGKRSDLLRDLHALGFTETMMFPELTHLAAELTRAEGWR